MQAIVETLFDAVYLISVITIGITMIIKSKGNKEYRLFGIMAVVLGAGDSFHLVPRALALCTTGLENFTTALGMGKFITSITMTVFYVILYYVWRTRYQVKGQNGITVAVYLLSALLRKQPVDPLSKQTSLQGGISIGNTFNLELDNKLSAPGDYLYRSGSFKWDVESGMWGILRVLKKDFLCKCKNLYHFCQCNLCNKP